MRAWFSIRGMAFPCAEMGEKGNTKDSMRNHSLSFKKFIWLGSGLRILNLVLVSK